MSYNIDSAKYISGSLSINGRDAIFLRDAHKREMPESNFLDEIKVVDPDALYPIQYPWWQGEGSGRSRELFKHVLTKTQGEAEILIVWEGGDCVSGLHVRNGTVTEKAVRFVLE